MQLSNASPYPIRYDLSNCGNAPQTFTLGGLLVCNTQNCITGQAPNKIVEILDILTVEIFEKTLRLYLSDAALSVNRTSIQ